jgi:hypothetical protein
MSRLNGRASSSQFLEKLKERVPTQLLAQRHSILSVNPMDRENRLFYDLYSMVGGPLVGWN